MNLETIANRIRSIAERTAANRAKIELAKAEITAAEAILDDESRLRDSLSADGRQALSQAARASVDRATAAADEFMAEFEAISRDIVALLEAVPEAGTAVS